MGSARVALKDVDLPEKKSLVRMINSQNNERLFFADKVILVEGITDRLVLGSLLELAAARFRNSVAVEIIEVGGKGNFRDYRSILAGLLTPSFVVADLDYLSEVGAEATRSLFRPNLEKQYEILTADKKSLDRVALFERLGNAINEGETEELRHFWEYFRQRAMRLKEPRSEDEERAINADIERLSLDNIFILRHGEIEDYLPPGVREVKSIVEALVDRNWINRIAQSDRRVELGHIICTVLNVPESERLPFLEELARGIVEFPVPGSDVAKWSLTRVAVE